jgi:hypothetical protein
LVASINTNSTVSVTAGAVLQLNFTTTNAVGALVLNGVSQANGVYNSNNVPTYITGSGNLRVGPASVGPSGPARLTHSVSGNVLSLSWPAGQGWRLEYQTNGLTRTNWLTWPGSTATNSISVPLGQLAPTVFFRLAYP